MKLLILHPALISDLRVLQAGVLHSNIRAADREIRYTPTPMHINLESSLYVLQWQLTITVPLGLQISKSPCEGSSYIL